MARSKPKFAQINRG